MGRSTKPRNLVKRRRAQIEEALADVLVADRVPVHYLPTTPPDPRAPSKYPLPLIDRVLDYIGGRARASGRVRALAAQREQAKNLPRGAPPVEISVMPTWDTRLVNMRDFLATLSVEPAFPGTTNLTYVVPAGYTAFLRAFRYFTDPPAVGGPTDFLATLLVDESIVPDFVSMPFGPTMADYQDTFVIARQGQRLTLRIVGAVALPAGGDIFAFLYGNLRLSDGRAINQEVGEKVKPAKVIVEQPKPARAAAPTTCPPNHKLLRVQLADGSFEMRCVPVLGQSRGS